MKRSYKLFALTCIFSLFSLSLGSISAEPIQAAPLLISEIQTGSSLSASEEFIELYNNSDQTIDLAQYAIEYYSASAMALSPSGSPTQTIRLSGTLYPKGYFLATSTNYLTEKSNLLFSPTLADAGGALRLLRGSSSTEDLVGWGTAKLYEKAPHPKAGNGKSLSRNISLDEAQDTNDNSVDFDILALPTPDNTNVASAQEPEPEPELPPITSPIPDVSMALSPLFITEVLPNPASPATDEDDEYIELYNPNDQIISLAGYQLESGNSFSYQYLFTDGFVPALGYYTIFSKDSSLTLSNTSGVVRLKDPSADVISQTAPYENADDGSAWALLDGIWQWTLSPTPSAINTLRLPIAPLPKTVSSSKSAKPKAVASSKIKTASTKAKASPKAKSSAKPKVASATKSISNEEVIPPVIHTRILVGVGVLAVLYALYEYRRDIYSGLLRFRRYREIRREVRTKP